MRSRTIYLRSLGRQTCAQRNAPHYISLVRDALENATTRKKKLTVWLSREMTVRLNWIPLGLVLLKLWFSFNFVLILILVYRSLPFSTISLSLSRFTLTLFTFTLEMNSETITIPFRNSFSPYIQAPRSWYGQGTTTATTNNSNNRIEIETECMRGSEREMH